jgi:hypothetical protein
VVNETVTARSISGKMNTPWIGPAKEWFYLQYLAKGIEPSDVVLIRVIGLNGNNQEVVLYEGNNSFVNFAFIDPVTYPIIKLQFETTDVINLTPATLQNWFVSYKQAPEGILLFRGNGAPVTLQEGEPWSGKYSFVNLTTQNFLFSEGGQSFPVELKIFNRNTGTTDIQSIEIEAPAPLDSTVFTLETNTIGRAGDNDISITVNTSLVPEQYNFNDQIQLERYLVVQPDRQPPVLDVTVDGRYLVNGDVVAHNPLVKITILDDNIFRLKVDTTGIQILIKNLDTQLSRRVNFTDPNLLWRPASAEAGLEIVFTTELEAGEYVLSVQGADANGNTSGATPYTVSFFVTDELNVLFGEPFPNPSSSIFSFPIRLTGNELPESMSLKILSPDGRLIKHFNLEDVAGFYVGTNYLKWNAQNLDGSDIPSGLYYFKLELSVSGSVYSKTGRLVLLH